MTTKILSVNKGIQVVLNETLRFSSSAIGRNSRGEYYMENTGQARPGTVSTMATVGGLLCVRLVGAPGLEPGTLSLEG